MRHRDVHADKSGLGQHSQNFGQILLDYDSHMPSDSYLLVEFDDRARMLRGYTTAVPQRGPRTFRIRQVGERAYPRRWDPNATF